MITTKRILLSIILMFNGLLMGSNNFEYYSDGIYDAYVQMNKEVQAGLDERQMGEYAGKVLVAIDVENSSTVDIIFYMTIGNKNALAPTVVNYSRNGKNYLVFDAADRAANARLLQKKLAGYGLSTIVLDGGDGYEYTRNPIVIKKLVDDLKHAIRNTPVKVITIEKTKPSQRASSSQLPSLNNYAPSRANKNHQSKKRAAVVTSTSATKDFLYLKGKFCDGGFVQKDLLHIEGKAMKKGASVKGFDFVGTKEEASGTVALLLGSNSLYYKLRKSDCPGGAEPKPERVTEEKVAKREKTKPEKEACAVPVGNNAKYTCDFSTIRTAKNSDMQTVRLEDTTYNGKKNLLVDAKKSGQYWQVRHGGASALYLSDRYFTKACKK